MDIAKYNQAAWDELVKNGNRWTQPVSTEEIQQARSGDFKIVLTPQRPVPMEWFGELRGCQVLGLASGGGQQVPILAAAGANVTSFDNSQAQLDQDQLVADREGLEIRTMQGDMRDLGALEDESFDLVFHPCSNGFVPDVNPVWKEAFRVLKPGGRLLSGFINPLFFIFDYWKMEEGKLEVNYTIPFSDLEQLTKEKLQELIDEGEAMSFGHSLTDQIGGQLSAGFQLTGFYEDVWGDPPGDLLSKYIEPMIATLAEKPMQLTRD